MKLTASKWFEATYSQFFRCRSFAAWLRQNVVTRTQWRHNFAHRKKSVKWVTYSTVFVIKQWSVDVRWKNSSHTGHLTPLQRESTQKNAQKSAQKKGRKKSIFMLFPLKQQNNKRRCFSRSFVNPCVYKKQQSMPFNNIALQQPSSNNIFTFATGKKMDAFQNCL